MSSGKNEIVTIYSHVVSQVIFISTSGIAAGVTLLQTGIIQSNSTTLIVSFISFTLSIILGVFGLTTLLGQADSGEPNIHKGIVRWPNLVSIITFILGVSCFTYSLSSHFFSGENITKKPTASVITSVFKKSDLDCRVRSLNTEQRLLLNYFVEKAFPNVGCGEPASVSEMTKRVKKKKIKKKKLATPQPPQPKASP